MARTSTIAVLRSNAQILDLMAAQFEELASRTTQNREFEQLKLLARKCRILAGEMSETATATAA